MNNEDILTSKTKSDDRHWTQFILDLLESQGHESYATALKHYIFKITRDPKMPTAFYQPSNHVVSLNLDKMLDCNGVKFSEQDILDDDVQSPTKTKMLNRVSTLIRHELLHALLNHSPREITEIAKELGMNPNNLTQKDKDRIRSIIEIPNVIFRGWSAPRTGNMAGDMDLARYYDDVDKEVAADLKGVIREDYPEYAGLSYEELRKQMNKEDEELRQRLIVTRRGDFDPVTRKWVTDSDDESDYSFGKTEFDIRDIRIIPNNPTLIDKKILTSYIDSESLKDIMSSLVNTDAIWLKDEVNTPGSEDSVLCYKTTGNIAVADVAEDGAFGVVPILKVKNLDLYDNITNECTLFGYKWLVNKDYNFLILKSSIGETRYNKPFDKKNPEEYNGNYYSDSLVERMINNWFKKNYTAVKSALRKKKVNNEI